MPSAKKGCCMRRREALASTQIVTPRIPVVSNVDAQPHSDPDTIKDILARQVRSAHCGCPKISRSQATVLAGTPTTTFA